MEKYYVYIMYNNKSEVLYVGQTTILRHRITQHFGKEMTDWKRDVSLIKFARCESYYDMCIYELYYIGKLRPKYNKAHVHNSNISIKLNDLQFITYTDYKNIKLETNINKDKLKKLVTIYGDDNTKINKNFINTDDWKQELYCVSDRWFDNNLNKENVSILMKNCRNFISNIYKEFKVTSVALYPELDPNTVSSECNGFKKRINIYEDLRDEECLKIQKLIYMRNVFGGSNNRKLQDKVALNHFLNFISKSAIIYDKPVVVYCPSKRVRMLLYEYLNS